LFSNGASELANFTMLIIIIIILTSGQSNLKKDRIAATHGRFSRVRQVVPACFSKPTRVHIPNGISIGSAGFAQLMAESMYFKMGHPFNRQICPFALGVLDPI